MKLVTISGEFYAKSSVSKGFEAEDFDVQCVYPFELTMKEDKIEKDKRQRAFMFLRNFMVEDALKDQLKAEKQLKTYGGSIRTATITEVSDFNKEDLNKPEYERIKKAISYKVNGKTKLIKPLELTFEDIQEFTSDQIIFTLMYISDPSKEDVTQLISRHMHTFKKGAIEEKRKVLVKFLGLVKEEKTAIPVEMDTGLDDFFEKENKPAPKSTAKADTKTDDLESAAGVKA